MPRRRGLWNPSGASFTGSSPETDRPRRRLRRCPQPLRRESRHLPARPAVFPCLPSSPEGAGRNVRNVNTPTILGAAALLLALAPQSAAAALTPSASRGAAAHAPYRATASPDPGDVVVVVPGSAIARGDGLDAVMRRGQTYRAEFVVWVAPNVGSATLDLSAEGAGLSHCTSPRLRPGTTSAVMCLVQTGTEPSESAASTDVVVQTSNLGTFSRTFTHALTG
jgi:hypothetical protein